MICWLAESRPRESSDAILAVMPSLRLAVACLVSISGALAVPFGRPGPGPTTVSPPASPTTAPTTPTYSTGSITVQVVNQCGAARTPRLLVNGQSSPQSSAGASGGTSTFAIPQGASGRVWLDGPACARYVVHRYQGVSDCSVTRRTAKAAAWSSTRPPQTST